MDRLLQQLREIGSAAREMPADGPLLLEGSVCEPDKSHWLTGVDRVRNGIVRGDFSKVVMSRSLLMKISPKVTAGQVIEALEQNQEPSYLFAFETPSRLAFIGRSPERLLSWQGANFQVDAIAGTRARRLDPALGSV